ncbi:MAG: Lrp/AsnC family transcriptional regulator [Nanoarchaeota archaeon]|nr:Lrp/AsnC family transcriptional regulator [Nanoarchaeota archaeon]
MIDDTDKEILSVLGDNARTPFLNIAKQLGVSESTIRKRVGNLEDRGVIKKYSVVVEPAKLGYGSVAIVGIDVVPEKFLSVAKKLTEFDNVKFVATSTGDHMIMTEIWMDKASELRDFISNKIEKIDGVTRTCPAIINEKLKEM